MQFSKIPGHIDIKNRLIRTVQEQRISSTQLFFGPEGSGSLALAIAFCQYIACAHKTSEDSCGKCASCLKFEKLSHPDLHFSFPANRQKEGTKDMESNEFIQEWRSFLLKDFFASTDVWQEVLRLENKQLLITTYEASQIIKKLNYKAFESEYKFLIMWLPEKMNLEASNRLLKTLEEPFEKTLIIMVTEDYDALLKTIISRSQLMKIPAYSSSELKAALMDLMNADENTADRIAGLAEGNFSKAKWLIEQNEIASMEFERLRRWMRDIITLNVTELLNHTSEFAANGRENQKAYLSYVLYMLRQLMVFKYNPQVAILSKEEEDFANKFMPFVQIENFERIVQLYNDAIYHIERNGSSKMIFFDLSLTVNKFLKKEMPVA